MFFNYYTNNRTALVTLPQKQKTKPCFILQALLNM
jgi:hypothetical protein